MRRRPGVSPGGRPGTTNAIEVVRGTERIRLTRPPRFALCRGDRVRILTGGGGGWGDPLDRAPRAVVEDCHAGLLDPAEAEAVYGVVLRAGEVDLAASRARRAGLR